MVSHRVHGSRNAFRLNLRLNLGGRLETIRASQDVKNLITRQTSTSRSALSVLSGEGLIDLLRFNREPGKLCSDRILHLAQGVLGLLREKIDDAARSRHPHRIHTETQEREVLGTHVPIFLYSGLGPVAQRIEQPLARRKVEGSNPSGAICHKSLVRGRLCHPPYWVYFQVPSKRLCLAEVGQALRAGGSSVKARTRRAFAFNCGSFAFLFRQTLIADTNVCTYDGRSLN
jgi:hypothetical protein